MRGSTVGDPKIHMLTTLYLVSWKLVKLAEATVLMN